MGLATQEPEVWIGMEKGPRIGVIGVQKGPP
jgi:hypothetical protein